MRRSMLIFALLLLCSALGARAQTVTLQTENPRITVSGQAEINVTPDMAVFSLSVVTLDKDLARATALNDESVKKTLALAKEYRIAPEDVQTSYISINTRESEPAPGKPPVFLGYQVIKQIVLTLRDMNRIEGLLSAVIKAGVNRVGNIAFRTTQLRQHKDRARQLAIKAAQEKAIALTKEIGQTIGKAYYITEEGSDRRGSLSNFSSNTFEIDPAGDASDAEGTIAVGQIPIVARVTVSFELK